MKAPPRPTSSSPLIHEQVELHNVAALEPVPGHGPCGMVRYPAAVRQHMTADPGYLIGASFRGNL